VDKSAVIIRGGGDLGSGVAVRLWRCGFPVVILETEHPLAVRRTVAFAEAVYDLHTVVEEVHGQLADSVINARLLLDGGVIPILVDRAAALVSEIQPAVLVDAIMAKRNTGTTITTAPLVIALGPGFEAGIDAHAVIETNRGPDLGRVLWHGSAESNTGTPGPVAGKMADRVLRAPASGRLRTIRQIGDIVASGEPVAAVGGDVIEAPFHGLLRGLARDGLQVDLGMKIGDLDPRFDRSVISRVSDKALAIAGGVLEAILVWQRRGI
jgi:xanthine dehydrogenase accessory factor